MFLDLALAALLSTEPTEPPHDMVPVELTVGVPDEPAPGTVVPVPPGTAPAPRRSIRFPVLGPVIFGDSFGDCRDLCARHHEGIDLLGVQMQPLVAAADGTVTRIIHEGAKSGNGIVITDADGWSYVYYHVNNDPPGNAPLPTLEATLDAAERWRAPAGLEVGDTVTSGQVIGWMGNSGNAEHSGSHLHFELRDPDGAPVNPYTSLRAAEFEDRCRPAPDRPVPVTSPPHVVQGTVFTFGTATGQGWFTISSTGGVLADADAATVGNPNHAVVNCFAPVPEFNARALPDPDADLPTDDPAAEGTTTTEPGTSTTEAGSTTTTGPSTTSADGSSTTAGDPTSTSAGSSTTAGSTTTTVPAPTTTIAAEVLASITTLI